MSKTMEIAEMMLKDGGWFTTARLGKMLGRPPMAVSGYLYSIRKNPKYQTEETPMPGRKIRVVSINGRRQTAESLWRVALFGVNQG